MPFICSSALRGLPAVSGGVASCTRINVRVSDGFYGVETALDYQFDIARSQSIDTLCVVSADYVLGIPQSLPQAQTPELGHQGHPWCCLRTALLRCSS